MEGISGEAASLAGHLGCRTCAGSTTTTRSPSTAPPTWLFRKTSGRFRGYGWQVLHVADANDLGQLDHALTTFLQTAGKSAIGRR